MEDKAQAENRLRYNILEAMVEAALQGQDPGRFEPVYEPRMLKHTIQCLLCYKSVYMNHQTIYNIIK